MHTSDLTPWTHDHSFGQEEARPGESRTKIVVLLTAVMMVGEITAGLLFGSMALLADGLHMASHAVALGLALLAYVYARRHAHDRRFSFGTGKVNALGGFTGALLLTVFAVIMAFESLQRFMAPVTIYFDQAIYVASLGLAVNFASAWILRARPGERGHHHEHGHHDHGHDYAHHHGDHNLRSAYLHVLADALTSIAAIVALLAGKYMGLAWMDPAMGLVGSVLVAIWARSLLKESARVLLDHQAPEGITEAIQEHIEGGDDSRIADLHVWSVGPGIWAANIAVVAHDPRTPEEYRAAIPAALRVVHSTVEVHRCCT